MNIKFYNCYSILFIVSLFLLHAEMKAQTTVQVGTGTDNPGTLPTYSPVYRYSASSTTTNARSNILFTQAELAAAGITTGSSITALQFEKIYDKNFVTPANFSMYMGNSSNTSLSNTTTWASIVAAQTQVYTNTSFNLPASAGWVTFNITPFIYTGGSLEMATDLVMGGNGATNGFWTWQYTASVPTNMVIGAAGATAPATLNGTTTGYLHRPNTRFTFTAGVMPVKLVDFTAIQHNSDISLNWVTASEVDFSHYEIERSLDGITYTQAGIVNSKSVQTGNNVYSFIDVNVLNGNPSANIIYYHLKMVDKDGRYEYSNVITVKPALNIADRVIVSPNPFSNEIFIKVNLAKAKDIQVVLTDINGRIISTIPKTSLVSGTNTITIGSLEGLNKGVYLLKVIADGKQTTLKLFK